MIMWKFNEHIFYQATKHANITFSASQLLHSKDKHHIEMGRTTHRCASVRFLSCLGIANVMQKAESTLVASSLKVCKDWLKRFHSGDEIGQLLEGASAQQVY